MPGTIKVPLEEMAPVMSGYDIDPHLLIAPRPRGRPRKKPPPITAQGG